jgi:UDP-glucose 6-dehydrogenase
MVTRSAPSCGRYKSTMMAIKSALTSICKLKTDDKITVIINKQTVLVGSTAHSGWVEQQYVV